MSNAKPATSSKGSKKGGKGEAPEPPLLDASAPADVARAFSNAWTVDVTRSSPDTAPRRAQAIGAALKVAPESMRAVLDALVAYVPKLGEVDAVMTRDSKTPKERETRKPWQSRLAGVGIVAHALRLAQSDEADAALAALLASSSSEMVREEIAKALLGDATLGTKPGALDSLVAFLDDPACTDLALLRAGFRSLYTMDPKKAHARWRKVLAAPDVMNPRAVWLAKIAFEQMEAHKADVDDLAPVVFPLIKLPKSGRGEDLQTAAVRYAGLTRDHYLALIKYVSEKDDAQVLVDAIAERFYWASLGANGVKQEEVRPLFKALEKRYLDSGDNARAGVFTKLVAGLAREGKS
ncbi:MAG: hypothetical protein NVS3B10_22940 [Polyangiales bacterium]